ncbi:MAG: insulinase family protein, partial [Oscillospiraceae bacterium]|nr:insulinase family protein [Oscillospiraceae bacterium]
LNNMVISIAGNFDADAALAICDRLLKPNVDIALQAVIPDEPPGVKQTLVRERLPVGIPLFQIGFKCPNDFADNKRNYVLYNILLEMLFGDSSAFYKDAYESGLLNDTFSVSVFTGRGFFMPIAAGEAREPEKVFAAMKAEFRRCKSQGLSEGDFARIKKQTYGELISDLTSAESVASAMLNAEFEDLDDCYEPITITASAAFDEILAILQSFDEENACLSFITNTEE